MNVSGRKKKDEEKQSSVFTRETFGVVTVLFATLVLVCLISDGAIFSAPGHYVGAFFYGCFGVFAYAVVIYAITKGVLLIAGKKINMSAKRKALFTVLFVLAALISHIASMGGGITNYGEYISQSYARGNGGIVTATGGGAITGIVAFAFSALLTEIGSYVILSIAAAGVIYAIAVDYLKSDKSKRKSKDNAVKFRSSYVGGDAPDVEIKGVKDYPVEGAAFSAKPEQKLFVNNPDDFGIKSKREMAKGEGEAIKLDLSDGGLNVGNTYSEAYGEELKKKLDYIKTPAAIDVEKTLKGEYIRPVSDASRFGAKDNEGTTTVSDFVPTRGESVGKDDKNEKNDAPAEIPFFEHDGGSVSSDSASARAEKFTGKYASINDVDAGSAVVEPTETFRTVDGARPTVDAAKSQEIFGVFGTSENKPAEKPAASETVIPRSDRARIPFIEETDLSAPVSDTADTENKESGEVQPAPTNLRDRRARNIFFGEDSAEDKKEQTEEVRDDKPITPSFTSRVSADDNGTRRRLFDIPTSSAGNEQKKEEKPPKPPVPINRKYNRPPLDLLNSYDPPIDAPQENHEERKEIIRRTLEEFRIAAVPQGHIQGPTITRYEIKMPAGIPVKRVVALDDDLRMRLAAKSGVRIEAPIPGKDLVGIEVANENKTTVGLKEVMEGLAGKKVKEGSLMFALGKDIVGNCISDNLAKGPHFLVAGATGSGKSVCLHVMIVSMLMRYSPEELKLVLVDPKGVEFRKYEHIPHLLVDEIISEPKRAIALLTWAYQETTRRNDMFVECGGEVSNIEDYNSIIASDTVPKLPRIVFVIDELADLMEAEKKDLEARIRMIAAKSRSAGIHLVLATQRPSVDVITGTIKANLPSRIALKVMNFNDSQTILSEAGAEKLLGNGDMLYKNSGMSECERYQGAFISPKEISNVVNYIKENNKAYFDDDVAEFINNETSPKQEESVGGVTADDNSNELDEFFLKALWLAVNTETVSISQLQRRFQIGYARAGGLVDKMERMGFVSGNEGSKARRVLLSKEDYEAQFGEPPSDAY